VSRVGADDLGRELRDRVRELGLSNEYIQTDHDRPTGTVQVTLGADAVPTYTITENVAWDHIEWDERLEGLAKTCRAVCLGTLAQRAASRVAVRRYATDVRVRLSSEPESFGLVVFDVNLRGNYFAPYQLEWALAVCDWCKVNTDELAVLLDLFDCQSLPQFVESMIRERLYAAVIITRGEDGCDIYSQWEGEGRAESRYHSEEFHQPGVPANVVDTVGAGDAFTAAMVCLHLEGKPLRECARFAVHYAARVCEQPGGTPRVSRAEVERAAGLTR
jgi:fructokinase